MNKKRVLRGRCDRAWYLKLLKPKCEICDNPGQQVHHFYYKSSYAHLRYDLENGITLCNPDHFLLHHQDPKRIEDQIIAKRGVAWQTELKQRAYKRPSSSWQTLKYYTDKLEELKRTA